MSACTRWLLVSALCGVVASTPMLQAEDVSTLLARVHTADTASSLEDASLKPWHLKVSFQLFDGKGNPSEQGTMEEWWNGPKQYKLSFASPSYTSTEIQNQDGLFRTTGTDTTPYILRLLHSQLTHPMSLEQHLKNPTPVLHIMTAGKMKLDCIMLSLRDRDLPLGSDPTYCLDHDTNTFRMSYITSSMFAARDTIGLFQERSVALDILVFGARHKILGAHVMALQSSVPDTTKFAPTPDMSIVKNSITIGSLFEARRKKSGIDVHYPEEARFHHISGSVLLSAVIGIDGHIHHLEVIDSPDDDLSEAATKAVQQWTYEPYLLNGVPVEVHTTITINFRLGPKTTFGFIN